jgi:hypothetical protein
MQNQKRMTQLTRSLGTLALLLMVLIALPAKETQAQPTTRVQIIHNAADPMLDTVDVWFQSQVAGGPAQKAYDDVAFRTATSFQDRIIGAQNDTLLVALAPMNSDSIGDSLASFELPIQANDTTAVIAHGVNPDSTMNFAMNPSGKDIGIDLHVVGNARETAPMDSVSLYFFHGVTDAPAIDIVDGASGATLVDSLAYEDAQGYLTIPTGKNVLEIQDQNGNVVKSLYVNSNGLGGTPAIVTANGFLAPGNNENGPALEAQMTIPDGVGAPPFNGTVTTLLPEGGFARTQVIHAAADPAADTVDLYVNGSRAYDDVPFNAATPYFDAPAATSTLPGSNVNVGIAPGNSSSVNDTVFSATYPLTSADTVAFVATGVLNPMDFASNPDGRAIDLGVHVVDPASENAPQDSVDLYFVHGVTDAPTVDIFNETAGVRIVDDLAFNEGVGYIRAPAGDNVVSIRAQDSTVLKAVKANSNPIAGGACIITATGFADTAANNDGPGLEVLLARAQAVQGAPFNGNVAITLPDTMIETSIDEKVDNITRTVMYPNPARGNVTLSAEVKKPQSLQIRLMNVKGQTVRQRRVEAQPGENTFELNTRNLSAGTYLYQLRSAGEVSSGKLILR